MTLEDIGEAKPCGFSSLDANALAEVKVGGVRRLWLNEAWARHKLDQFHQMYKHDDANVSFEDLEAECLNEIFCFFFLV